MTKNSYVIVRYMDKPYFFEGLDRNDRAIWRSNIKQALAFVTKPGAEQEAKDNELKGYVIEISSLFIEKE